MTHYFKRIVRLRVAGASIEGLKITFRLQRQPNFTGPTGQITIYNLSKDLEQQIEEKGQEVELEAGYPDTVNAIFSGFASRIIRLRRAHARQTVIELAGQDVSENSTASTGTYIDVSYNAGAGVTARQIASEMISQGGFEASNLEAIPDTQFQHGYSITAGLGYALGDLMRQVSQTVGHGTHVSWYLDDGVIRFNQAGEVDPIAGSLPRLSPATGLIDTPAVTDQGVECWSFLNPLARIGARVPLESETVSGDYKLVSFVHHGSSWDGEFRTGYSLRPLGGDA